MSVTAQTQRIWRGGFEEVYFRPLQKGFLDGSMFTH